MTASAVATSSDPGGAIETNRPPGRGNARWVTGGVAVAVVAGVVLRLYSSSPLWLDEAMTVNISARGVGELRAALERDGAPPLFYALLTAWMRAFGDSDVAVRLLPAVFSIAALPLAYRMGLRRGGPRVAAAALVLVATSPFAIRYATEVRMYSLVALLVMAGWLAVTNALLEPRLRWLAATGACTGLLLLTHYWALYLVAVTGAVLVVVAWRMPPMRRPSLLVLAAMAIGAVAFFGPWMPSFVYQVRNTGAPWATAPSPVAAAMTTFVDFGGVIGVPAKALAALLVGLLVLAVMGRALDWYRIELDLRTRPGVRTDLAVAAATLLLGGLVGLVTDSAWASRYSSVIFPLVLVAAAFGVVALIDDRVAAVVLAVAALLGLASGVRNWSEPRTQAREVAAALGAAGAGRGDVVAYCPDQLGPDVKRLAPTAPAHVTFPDLADATTVNWVDYEQRMTSARAVDFANDVVDRAGSNDVYLVWMSGYRTLGTKCEEVARLLSEARPGARQLVGPAKEVSQKDALWIYPGENG